ncbi:MAG: hypothetical protein CVV17_12095, partial [Gammaproteobacteria bacterium HGW-Gammaproteobacteria-7]
MAIGRRAGNVTRQLAAALDHDAQAAEREHFQRHRAAGAQALDLLDRQHPRQHCTRNAETLVAIAQRGSSGGRALHRQMPRQLRMGARGVIEHRHFGGDDGVGTQISGAIHGGLEHRQPRRIGIGIERDVQLAPALVRVIRALAQFGLVEVEAGEGTRVGLVAEPDIDRVGTGILQSDREAPNRAQDDYGSAGITAKAKLSATTLHVGTLQPILPVVMRNDSRLLPQTYRGAWLQSKEVSGLTLDLGMLDRVNQRDSSDNEEMTVFNAGRRNITFGSGGSTSDEFLFAGGRYDWS